MNGDSVKYKPGANDKVCVVGILTVLGTIKSTSKLQANYKEGYSLH